MRFAITLSALILGLICCRTLKNAAEVKSEGVSAEAPASADIPVKGRSIFDVLTTTMVNGKPVQRIPYPLNKIAEQFMTRPGVALIPSGRSLQRLEAAPDFFKFPRVVFGDTHVKIPTGPTTTAQTLAPMFVGYLEATDAMEVISWNVAMRRFEFQIVKNYSKGDAQQIVYADRGLCISCHQEGTPIFSAFPWTETNRSPDIKALLTKANSGANNYLSFPIDNDSGVINLDEEVFRSYSYKVFQDYYKLGCKDVPNPSTCRITLLKTIFFSKVMQLDDEMMVRILEPLRATFDPKLVWPFQLTNKLSAIANRLPGVEGLGTGTEIATANAKIQEFAEKIPVDANPLTPFKERVVPFAGGQPLDNVTATFETLPALVKRSSFAIFGNTQDLNLVQDMESSLETITGDSFKLNGTVIVSENGDATFTQSERLNLGVLKETAFPFRSNLTLDFGTGGFKGTCAKVASGLSCEFGNQKTQPTSGNREVNNIKLVINQLGDGLQAPELSSLDMELSQVPKHLQSRCFDFTSVFPNAANQGIFIACSNYKIDSLARAFNNLEHDAASLARLFGGDDFDLYTATERIFTDLNVKFRVEISACCDATQKFPEAKPGTIDALPRALIVDPKLQSVVESCYRCHHTEGGPLPFLRGLTEAGIFQEIRANIEEMRDYVTSAHMPPRTSPEGQALGSAGSAGRQALLHDLDVINTQ